MKRTEKNVLVTLKYYSYGHHFHIIHFLPGLYRLFNGDKGVLTFYANIYTCIDNNVLWRHEICVIDELIA